jgi:predicted transcriptional regulator
MNDRQLILDAVHKMPETASLAEILDELRLLQSVAQGLADTERGKVTPHDEVAKKLGAWITKSSGRTAA